MTRATTVTQCPKFGWCVMGHAHKGQCSSAHYTLTEVAEPRVEAGDRALETARKVVKLTKYEIARCGKDIYDNTSRVYGCCRPEGHDGPHETLKDRHVGRYTEETENKKRAEVAELIQSAMNVQERDFSIECPKCKTLIMGTR